MVPKQQYSVNPNAVREFYLFSDGVILFVNLDDTEVIFSLNFRLYIVHMISLHSLSARTNFGTFEAARIDAIFSTVD